MDKKVIGLTGGIGSGKSAIREAFAALGIPAYDCDSRAKALYREDASLAARVAELLGADVLAEDGTLDVKKMAARLFGDRSLMTQLEAIVHPAVAEDFLRWAVRQESSVVIMESAILLEKPFFDKFADFVVAVSAPEDVRIERVMHRDGASRQQVERRLASQWTDAQREARANLVLHTDDRTPVLPQIIELIEKLKTN
jgi:dephospho-CoA kinase